MKSNTNGVKKKGANTNETHARNKAQLRPNPWSAWVVRRNRHKRPNNSNPVYRCDDAKNL